MRRCSSSLTTSIGPSWLLSPRHTAHSRRRTTRRRHRSPTLPATSGRGRSQAGCQESDLKQKFTEEVSKWDAAEDDRLAQEPLSQDKIAALQAALRETLAAEQRLASEIPTVADVPDRADESHPILGMNLRVPRHYLVDEVFNQTYADPKDLGQIIARGFMDGEEQRILGQLRSQHNDVLAQPPKRFDSRSTPWETMHGTTSLSHRTAGFWTSMSGTD